MKKTCSVKEIHYEKDGKEDALSRRLIVAEKRLSIQRKIFSSEANQLRAKLKRLAHENERLRSPLNTYETSRAYRLASLYVRSAENRRPLLRLPAFMVAATKSGLRAVKRRIKMTLGL